MKHLSVVFVFLFLLSGEVYAEPWLSNKYSTNCAACHSPGRINRAPKKRKCTLSCQGCHVNPNGGGIRNHYGKWNSQRWLRSHNLKSWLHGKKTPMPRNKQAYASKYPKKVRPKNFPAKAKKFYRPNGKSPLASFKAPYINKISYYDKYFDTGWAYTAKSDKEFVSFLSFDDPYNLKKRENIITNFEARAFYLANSGDKGQSPAAGYKDSSGMGVMALDVGLSYRPFLDRAWSFVYEHRNLNSPYTSDWNAIFQRGVTRSAYVLYDGLPYNTYVMAGLYRPMFGHTNSNHRSLRETILFGRNGGAGSAALKYEGVSVGTSPNVPFANLHYLTDTGVDNLTDGSTGFILNGGLRFVTMGASLTTSYWSTKNKQNLKKDMLAIALGAHFINKLTVNGEFVGFDEESTTGRNKGSVMSADVKYQFYKETYATFGYAFSNTSRTQTKGSASDLYIGVKTFPLAGVEIDLSYYIQSNEDKSAAQAVSTDWNTLVLQTHFYF